MPGMLILKKVVGKVILCDHGISPLVRRGYVVNDAGGSGTVLASIDFIDKELIVNAHLLLTTDVGEKDGNTIRAYLLFEISPTASIVFGGMKVGAWPLLVVVAFSLQGPNKVTPEILKSDLIAPGINIPAITVLVSDPV